MSIFDGVELSVTCCICTFSEGVDVPTWGALKHVPPPPRWIIVQDKPYCPTCAKYSGVDIGRDPVAEDLGWVECTDCRFRVPLFKEEDGQNLLKKHRAVCPAKS